MDTIVKIIEPTIAVKEIAIPLQEENGEIIDIGDKMLGQSSPFIVINTMQFWDNNIMSFELSTEDFLPKINCIIKDINYRLINEFLPLDDILCLYIRSDNTDFVSVRQDYRITSFVKLGDGLYSVEAILDVPGLFVDKIKGLTGTTFSAMKSIAEELGLGFASNIEDTNDEMYHLCANSNYADFIREELMSYIYKDDNSFFTCYIDQFYYLNLIEINSLISKEINLEEVSYVSAGDELHIEKEKKTELLFLSNTKESEGRANYIESFEPISSSGRRGIKDGYRNNIIYYDKDRKEHIQYFVESLTTEGVEGEDRIIKGERNEDHTVNTRNIHHGVFLLDNAHENYLFAKTFNKLNINEINKFSVKFYLSGVNFALSNYMVIPIHIINKSEIYEDIESGNAMNVPMSGNYIITGMTYTYPNETKVTKLSFTGKKREFRKNEIDPEI